MRIRRLLLLALLSAALPLTAAACGVCIEDKVAATYDHEVVTKAARDNHAVMYFEITGLASRVPPTERWLVNAVEKTRGVESGSVRVSLEQAAVSFTIDPNRHPVAGVKKLIEQKLLPQQLGLKPLRTLYKGKLSAPA